MSNQADHIIARLRLPPELRDKIAESAKAHNRSMNADMVARLERSFVMDAKKEIFRDFHPNQLPPDTLETIVTVLENVQETLKKFADK